MNRHSSSSAKLGSSPERLAMNQGDGYRATQEERWVRAATCILPHAHVFGSLTVNHFVKTYNSEFCFMYAVYEMRWLINIPIDEETALTSSHLQTCFEFVWTIYIHAWDWDQGQALRLFFLTANGLKIQRGSGLRLTSSPGSLLEGTGGGESPGLRLNWNHRPRNRTTDGAHYPESCCPTRWKSSS